MYLGVIRATIIGEFDFRLGFVGFGSRVWGNWTVDWLGSTFNEA